MTTIGEMCDLVRGRSPEIEAAGRLPDDVAARLRESGIFRQWLPRELGGVEAVPAEVVASRRRPRRGGRVGGLVRRDRNSQQHVRRLCAADRRRGNVRHRDRGGVRIVGARWPGRSGAGWWDGGVRPLAVRQRSCPQRLGRRCVMPTGGGPADAIVAIMARQEVEQIAGTWDVVGLRGTGSADFLAESSARTVRSLHPT